jgi:uncharacterized membrane protein YfhO
MNEVRGFKLKEILFNRKAINLIMIYIFFMLSAVAMHYYFISSGAYFNEVCCDSVKQISYFYPFLERMFEQGEFFWSWNYGLGGDVFGQFLYYFSTSPFFWLSIILFNFDSLKDVFEFRLFSSIFKLTLTMIFSYHLFHYLKRTYLSSLVGSLIYGGAVYFTFYSLRYDFMVDGMVWLPLLILGYERLLLEKKKGLFLFTVFLVICSNFYLAFINSIFLGLYSIFKYFVIREKYTLKSFLDHMIHFAGMYLIGFLLAAFAFLPAVYNYLNVDRFYYEHSIPMFFSTEYYLSLPYHLFFQSKTLSTVIILPVATLFIMFYGIWVQKAVTKKVTLFSLIIFLMFLIPFVYSMFNGFSSIQFRWLYLFVFMTAYGVTYILDEMRERYLKKEILFGAAILLFLTGVIKFKHEIIEVYATKNDMVILGIAFLVYVLLISRKRMPKPIFSIGLVAIVLFNTVFVNHLLIRNFLGDPLQLKERQVEILESSNYGVTSEQEVFKELNQKDSGFYRVIWNNLNEFNAPLLYGYNGVSAYNSLISGNVHQFLKNEYNTLQYNAPSLYKNVDNRIFIETMLGSKYYLLNKDEIYKPFGYSKWKEINDHVIYQNNYTLPIGFMYNQAVLKETFDSLSYAEKDELLLKAAVVENKVEGIQDIDPEKLEAKVKDIDIDEIEFNHARIDGQTLKVEENGQLIIPSVIPDEEGETLFQINLIRNDGEKYSLDVNNKTFNHFGDNNIYNYPKEEIVINLGYRHTSKDITVTLTPGEYQLGTMEVQFNSFKTFMELREKRQEQSLGNIEYSSQSLSGTINANQKGILFFSIPYSKGWKVKIDGNKVQPLEVNTAFIGVPLSKGEHEIELNFVSPLVMPGLIISSMTFLLIMGYMLWRNIITRKKKEGEY